MMEYNTGFILSRLYIAVSESLFGGMYVPSLNFKYGHFAYF